MINLRSELHLTLLGYFFDNPDSEHYVRELSKILSLDVAHLSRELSKLTDYGLFVSRQSGREKFFRLNHDHKFFHEIRSLVFDAITRNKNSTQ